MSADLCLSRRRRRWCRRCLVLDRADLDGSGQKRSVGILEIGTAYLVVLVNVVDRRGFPVFSYGCAVNDFQNARFASTFNRECLRVFVDGGYYAMIGDKECL